MHDQVRETHLNNVKHTALVRVLPRQVLWIISNHANSRYTSWLERKHIIWTDTSIRSARVQGFDSDG